MVNLNDSSSGGYLTPEPGVPYPGNLSFRQFLSTVFSGISGIDPTLCRPRWQANPPKQPDIQIDWLSIGIAEVTPDIFSYAAMEEDGSFVSIKHEELEIACSFYGPDALAYAETVQMGFQLPQNLEALSSARMGFKESGPVTHVPDLVHERWVNRYDMSVYLRRQVVDYYPILSFTSGSVVLNSRTSGANYSKTITIQEETP